MRQTLLFMPAFVCVAAQQPAVPKYDGKSLVQWLERFQKAKTDADRDKAVAAVSAFGADAKPAVPKLVEMLDDRSASYRAAAATMLSAVGPAAKDAVPDLKMLLEAPPPRDAPAVIRVLCAIGPDAVPALDAIGTAAAPTYRLANLSKDGADATAADRAALEAAFAGLHRVGPDAVPLLLKLIDTGYGTDAALKQFKKLVPDKPADVSDLSGWLLIFTRMRNQLEADARAEVTARVRSLLTNGVPAVQFRAAQHVWAADKDAAAVVPVFVGVLTGKDVELATKAADALGAIGPDASAALPALRRVIQLKATDLAPASEDSVEKLRLRAWVATRRIVPVPKTD